MIDTSETGIANTSLDRPDLGTTTEEGNATTTSDSETNFKKFDVFKDTKNNQFVIILLHNPLENTYLCLSTKTETPSTSILVKLYTLDEIKSLEKIKSLPSNILDKFFSYVLDDKIVSGSTPFFANIINTLFNLKSDDETFTNQYSTTYKELFESQFFKDFTKFCKKSQMTDDYYMENINKRITNLLDNYNNQIDKNTNIKSLPGLIKNLSDENLLNIQKIICSTYPTTCRKIKKWSEKISRIQDFLNPYSQKILFLNNLKLFNSILREKTQNISKLSGEIITAKKESEDLVEKISETGDEDKEPLSEESKTTLQEIENEPDVTIPYEEENPEDTMQTERPDEEQDEEQNEEQNEEQGEQQHEEQGEQQHEEEEQDEEYPNTKIQTKSTYNKEECNNVFNKFLICLSKILSENIMNELSNSGLARNPNLLNRSADEEGNNPIPQDEGNGNPPGEDETAAEKEAAEQAEVISKEDTEAENKSNADDMILKQPDDESGNTNPGF